VLTTWLTAFDVLPVKFESPAYTAVIAFVPGGRVEVVKLAEPPFNAPVPSCVEPSMNVTVSPAGVSPRLKVTVAVNVTACPECEGFSEETKAVVVVPLLATSLTGVVASTTASVTPVRYMVELNDPDVVGVHCTEKLQVALGEMI